MQQDLSFRTTEKNEKNGEEHEGLVGHDWSFEWLQLMSD